MAYKRSLLSNEPDIQGIPPVRARRGTTRPIIRSLRNEPVEQAEEDRESVVPETVHEVAIVAPYTVGQQPVYFVKDMRGLVRIEPNDIMFLQADGNYVELHLRQRRVVLRNSLAEVLKMLPPGLLSQVNRAQAVNVRHLDLIGPDEVRIGDIAFTLSKHYREPLLGCVQVITGR